MAIEFECPQCRSRIRTPDEAAGKKARCPHCQQISPVPASSSLEPLGNLGSSTVPLPSSQPAWPSANNPPQNSTPKPTTPPANPFLKPGAPSSQSAGPAAWLPPADAFAPIGSSQKPAQPGYSQPTYSQPASSNPFSEQATNYGGGPLNPYQSPSSAASDAYRPFSPEEIRQKLLGPAIGMALGAMLCIGVTAFFVIMIMVSPDFQDDAQNNREDFIAGCVVLGVLAIGSILPSLASLLGAFSMYRGKGLVTCWLGAIAGVMPCNFCFFITAGFAIWGMVVLSDPRVSAGMK